MKAFTPIERGVLQLLDEALSLRGRSARFTRETGLLGALPELDSMAMLSLITGLGDRFNIAIDDDELHADIFLTVGSIADFVQSKIDG